MAITSHNVDLCFRVLLYQEGSEYVAHALEMDLIGEGSSPNKALNDLRATIEAQISFAVFHGDPSLANFPAPPDVYARWEKASRQAIANLAAGDVSIKGHVQATFIAIPAAEMKRIVRHPGEFMPVQEEHCCAEA